MAPKFGTSGVRGLVTELTEPVVQDYTRAFLKTCETGQEVYVGWDLRESSPRIAQTVVETAQQLGVAVVTCGVLPTPALAYAAGRAKAGAIMVTGSHIPADRNGIKFYTSTGEISKQDEARIVACLGQAPATNEETGACRDGGDAVRHDYVARYLSSFAADALSGMKIGVYQHSSVARDILIEIFEGLRAEAIAIERTTEFVPVDTEAVDPVSREKFAQWCNDYGLDALVSTDGDADRPMVTDATGQIVPGDILGVLTAQYLGADVICTPVSSNSMIQQMPEFDHIHLTKIGSPYVVAAMEAISAGTKVVGYEANGGFLLGFPFGLNANCMTPLLTRDSVLPIIAPLVAAHSKGASLSDLVNRLPGRFTAADRVAGVPSVQSAHFIQYLTDDADLRADFFEVGAATTSIDTTDGLRVQFASGDIVHLRPSGNAPECRCYAESDTAERASSLVALHLAKLSRALSS